MSDRRLIAQSITNSQQVARLIRRCGPWAGMFFSWCIPFIDDDGRIDGDPETLRAMILGRYVDQVTVADVSEMVATINDLDLAVWYEVVDGDERYLYFPRFSIQQGLRADRYVPSRRPTPPSWTPDDGHPYSKNPELLKAKPPKDRRRTRRVPKRKPAEPLFAPDPRQDDNQLPPESRQTAADPRHDSALSFASFVSGPISSGPIAEQDGSLRDQTTRRTPGFQPIAASAARVAAGLRTTEE